MMMRMMNDKNDDEIIIYVREGIHTKLLAKHNLQFTRRY